MECPFHATYPLTSDIVLSMPVQHFFTTTFYWMIIWLPILIFLVASILFSSTLIFIETKFHFSLCIRSLKLRID